MEKGTMKHPNICVVFIHCNYCHEVILLQYICCEVELFRIHNLQPVHDSAMLQYHLLSILKYKEHGPTVTIKFNSILILFYFNFFNNSIMIVVFNIIVVIMSVLWFLLLFHCYWSSPLLFITLRTKNGNMGHLITDTWAVSSELWLGSTSQLGSCILRLEPVYQNPVQLAGAAGSKGNKHIAIDNDTESEYQYYGKTGTWFWSRGWYSTGIWVGGFG